VSLTPKAMVVVRNNATIKKVKNLTEKIFLPQLKTNLKSQAARPGNAVKRVEI
jgi:hypothetical protein